MIVLSWLAGDDGWAVVLCFGSVSRGLWSRWVQYVREEPAKAFQPRRVADADTVLEVWALTRDAFPGYVTIEPWRALRCRGDGEERRHMEPYLQPPPYMMARTLEAARELLPPTAVKLEGFDLVDRYVEAWLL